MLETTISKKEDPGAVPGASTQVTAGEDKGKGEATEQRSVEIAKPLSTRLGKGMPGHVQGCLCEACLILVVQPDAPTCKGCGRVVEVVDAEGFCGPCVEPAKPAKVKRVRKPRAKTHGKNGVPPLAAMPPDEAIPVAIREEGAMPVEELGHADTEPHHEGSGLQLDRRGGGNVGWTDSQGIPEEEEQPNDKVPPSLPFAARTVCKVCGDFEPCGKSHSEPMTCARIGCENRAVPGDVWCYGHSAAAAAADDGLPRRQLSKGVPANVLLEALEAAWVALAEDSTLDPTTVAVCKRLRELERGL